MARLVLPEGKGESNKRRYSCLAKWIVRVAWWLQCQRVELEARVRSLVQARIFSLKLLISDKYVACPITGIRFLTKNLFTDCALQEESTRHYSTCLVYFNMHIDERNLKKMYNKPH